MVTVDETALFRWAKNIERIWTKAAHIKDSLEGIVRKEDSVPQFSGKSIVHPDSIWNLSPSRSSSSLSTSTTSAKHSPDDVLSNKDPKHFTDKEHKAANMIKVVHASPAATFKRLWGKSVEKEDMWLFGPTLGCRYLFSFVHWHIQLRWLSALIFICEEPVWQ
jgi:hypothetical protein